jgi:NADH-ubiquinone oxidoreductase chain 1
MGPYCFYLSGLMSVSKYGLLGSLRSSVQSFSYEIIFFFTLFILILLLNRAIIINYNLFILLPLIILLILLVLGETGRSPFDFMEGESELVSGYNIEYRRVLFVFLFLSEYGIIIFFSLLLSMVTFSYIFGLFFMIFIYFLIIFRRTYPRYRYDIMMSFYWFILLPISI